MLLIFSICVDKNMLLCWFSQMALSAEILGFHRSLKRRPYSNKRTPHHNNTTRSNTARTLNPKPLHPNPKAEPCWLVVVLGPRGCSASSWATVPSTATEWSQGSFLRLPGFELLSPKHSEDESCFSAVLLNTDPARALNCPRLHTLDLSRHYQHDPRVEG